MKQILFYSPDPDDSGSGSSDDSDQSTTTMSAGSSSSSDDSSPSDDQSTDTSESNSSNSGSSDTTTQDDTSSADTDSEGFKLLSSGTWNKSTSMKFQGGQVMHFQIKNVNVLGTTLGISSSLGGKKSSVVLPQQSIDMRFDCFGSEPMGWSFDVSTDSDAFIVAWKLYSSWLPGDPPNG